MCNRVDIDIQKAIELYRDKKMSSTKVGRIVGCSAATLINRLRDAGIEIRSCGWDKQKIDFETIRHEYEDLQMSTTEIGNNHNMSPVSIWQRLVDGDIKMRDRKEAAARAIRKIKKSEHQTICNRYKINRHESCADIANDYGVHKTTISTILKRNNIIPVNEGVRNKQYKGGITELHDQIRHCELSTTWKTQCMKRDDYTCRSCNVKGGKLCVHHKNPFSNIFEKFLATYSDFDGTLDSDKLFQLALDYNPFWDINNGITLCDKCHCKCHNKTAPKHMRKGVQKSKNIDMGKAIDLYNSGMTATETAKEVGCSISVLLQRLRNNGIEIRHFSSYKQGCAPIETIEYEYNNLGMTTKQIAVKYGVSSSAIQKRLVKAGVQLRNHWEERRKNSSHSE